MGLLEATTSGLGYLGDVGDKLGGRAVRGALGGHPRELASVLPFSDSLGITDYRQKVSGRDLTDQWGLTSRHDNSLSSHLLGAGAELALDPMNLLGVGAASKVATRGLKGARIGGRSAHEAGGLRRFLGGDSGALDLDAFMRRMPLPGYAPAAEPVNRLFPDMADEISRGIVAAAQPARDAAKGRNGLSRFLTSESGALNLDAFRPIDRLHEAAGNAKVPVSVIPPKEYQALQDGLYAKLGLEQSPLSGTPYASYWPHSGPHEGHILVPETRGNQQVWNDPEAMAALMRDELGYVDGYGMNATRWTSTADPDHLIAHELAHALHHRHVGDTDRFFGLLHQPIGDADHSRLWHSASQYAAQNPLEAVAEIASKEALTGGHTYLDDLYQKWGGPPIDALRRFLGG